MYAAGYGTVSVEFRIPSANTGSSPVVYDGLLYIRDYMGSWLRAFDATDGKLVYEWNLAQYLEDTNPSSAYGSLTVAGGYLFVNSSRARGR